MERLLSDASKIAGVEFNIDSYSDVIQAIHVMQEEMGIAGTTAEEGAATISGSIGKLSASWQNFLTGIFDENADMGALGEQLFTSVGDVLKNVVPRIGVLIQNIILGLPNAIIATLNMLPAMLEPAIMSVFGEQVGGQIMEVLNGITGGMSDSFTTLIESLTTLFSNAYAVIEPVVTTIGELIAAVMPVIQEAIGFVIDFIATSVLPTISEILATFKPVIDEITKSIEANMPLIQQVVSKAMSLVKNVITTVWPYVKNIIMAAVNAIRKIIEVAWPIISTVITTAMEVISGIIDVAWPAIQTIIETVMGAIEGVMDTVWPVISGIVETAANAIKSAIEGIESVVGVVRNIFESVQRFIEDPIGEAKRFIEDIISDIENAFAWMNIDIPAPKLPHINWNWHEFQGPFGSISIPEFTGIEWYAKGGMVNGAQLIGAGERGAELIWPSYDPYLSKYADAIADRMGARGGVDIHDCTFNVRKDSDIRAVAQELNTLINRQTVGGLA